MDPFTDVVRKELYKTRIIVGSIPIYASGFVSIGLYKQQTRKLAKHFTSTPPYWTVAGSEHLSIEGLRRDMSTNSQSGVSRVREEVAPVKSERLAQVAQESAG